MTIREDPAAYEMVAALSADDLRLLALYARERVHMEAALAAPHTPQEGR